jgi:hypothetical protein
MVKLGGFCDVQPRQLISDAPFLEEIIGNEIRSMIDTGLTLVGSCDSPVGPANPLVGIQAAVLREPTMNLNERITIEEGLRMDAINSQKMIKNDHRKGLFKGVISRRSQVSIEQLPSRRNDCGRASAVQTSCRVRNDDHDEPVVKNDPLYLTNSARSPMRMRDAGFDTGQKAMTHPNGFRFGRS